MEQLVGREAELQQLRDALGTSPPVAIVLEGEPGIGKTALWRAGIAQAESAGLRTLMARPAEAETELSHAALGDLLARLVEELAGELPEPQRHALDVALLRAPPGATPVSPHAVGVATRSALHAAAGHGPLLLAVDDIQWMDAASANALRFAFRRLERERVVLLATRRLSAAGDVGVGLGDERVVRIRVGPLDPDGIHRLLQERLEATVPRPAAARVADVSGGNPYHALELAAAALRHSGRGSLSADLPLPESIYSVLQDRLRGLPPDTTDALGTLAAIGRLTLTSAAAAVDTDALDRAFAAGVLHEEGEAVRFDHPLLAEAAYRMLPPARRRSVHAELAAIAIDAEERARHLAASASTPDAGLALDIERGADAAAARGARSAAGQLLEAAARVEPDADAAALRRIAAVGHHMAAGDGRRARSLSDALVEELPPGPVRARALVIRAEQDGSVDEHLKLIRQAVAEAGDVLDVLLEALEWQGALLLLHDDLDEAEVVLAKAMSLCTPDVPRELRVRVLAGYADLANHRGEPKAVPLMREAAELEADDLIPTASWGPTTMLGQLLLAADELDEARALLEERYRRAVEVGDEESIGQLSIFRAELELRSGTVEAARGLTDGALALHEGSYGEDAQGAAAYARALVAAYEGDVALARELATRGLAQCEVQKDAIYGAANRSTLAFLEFSLGNEEAGLELFEPLARRFMDGDAPNPGVRENIIVPYAIDALVGLGRLGEAEVLLAAWVRAGEPLDRPRIHATAARSRALATAAAGDLDTAIGHAEAAMEHHRYLPVPFERARTLIVLGTLHRRAKHKAAARAALEKALEILEEMGVPLWADRARAELGRIGGRTASDGLTPTEQRVADLVAEGRSNKQVAAELFVSVRTVEANLTRIYAKLGLRSRTELASRRGR